MLDYLKKKLFYFIKIFIKDNIEKIVKDLNVFNFLKKKKTNNFIKKEEKRLDCHLFYYW